MILRPAVALSQKENRDPRILLNAGLSSIGRGPHKVLDNTYCIEFYYAGRVLGWKMFHSSVVRPLSSYNDAEIRRFLDRVDYAIFDEEVSEELNGLLEKSGLRFQKILVNTNKYDAEEKRRLLHRLSILLKRRSQYGPYRLYARS